MKKQIIKLIVFNLLLSLLPCITVYAAETINQKNSDGVINDINKAFSFTSQPVENFVNEMQTKSVTDKDYPIIDAFKSNVENDNEVENTTIKGTVETNAILSLDDAIKLALANNPKIASAISTTEIYKTKIGQAWSAYFPNLYASVGYDRIKAISPAEQMIFDFGKAKAQVNIAKKTLTSTENNLQETINSVIYSVKDAYYSLLYAIQQEQVYADTVERYDMHLKQARAFYDIGVKPKLDVITAEYNLSNAKLGHIKAKNDVEIAIANLNNAMGLPEYANYSIDEKIKLKKYEYDFKPMIDKAYDVRPELLAAKNKAEASEILVKASKRAFAPDLTVSGSYGVGGTKPTQDYGYSFGGGLSYPVTNLMYLKKQVDEAKATAKKDVADYELNKHSVYLAVKNAYINMSEMEETVPVTRNAMAQAKEQYDLASGRYKVGIGDIIELKDAENVYRNAQLSYYYSILNYNVSVANIEKVVGVPIEQIAKIINSVDL